MHLDGTDLYADNKTTALPEILSTNTKRRIIGHKLNAFWEENVQSVQDSQYVSLLTDLATISRNKRTYREILITSLKPWITF